MNFDSKGIPGVSVVTTGFTDAVDVQSRAMGFDPAVVYTPHPIQNRTTAEIEAFADQVYDKVIAALTSA
mgnify:CR=1 FL=1